jgi:PAS domain S-box-containing protein
MKDYGLLESAPDAMLIADEEGRIVFVNAHTEALFGYRRDEVLGRSVELLVPQHLQHKHVFHRRQYGAYPQARAMGAGVDLRARRRDGTEFPVDISISPLIDDEGMRVICAIRDISSRREIEESLRRSEARYRSLVEGATYGIYRTTLDGRLIHANPAFVRMLGFQDEREVRALNARDFYVDARQRDQLIERYRSGDVLTGVEARWKKGDGTPFTVRLSGRVLHDADGEVEFEMIAEDVTERLVLEERVRMAERLEAIGRLTAGVAHHFNNLLATVVGRLDVVRAIAGSDARVSGDLTTALDALQEATLLIRRMQDFGQRTEAAPIPLQPNDVLNGLLPLLKQDAGERVTVVLELGQSVPSFFMDRSHFEGIVVSLFHNARDAMPSGGTLTIRTEYDASSAMVRVTARDTGVGMGPGVRFRAFEPFFTTREDGTDPGLGLSVVYGLVCRSGGRIRAESEPGRGTAFIMEWPAMTRQE